jgi:hypothetical protein
VTHDLNFPEITRTWYLRRWKNRRGTFYSVPSVKKKGRKKKRKEEKLCLPLRGPCASSRVDLARRRLARNSLPFSASFAVDFIRHCETRCNAVGCLFSLSLSLSLSPSLPLSLSASLSFIACTKLDRAPMQTRKLDRIPGIIRYLKRKVPRRTIQSFISHGKAAMVKSGPRVCEYPQFPLFSECTSYLLQQIGWMGRKCDFLALPLCAFSRALDSRKRVNAHAGYSALGTSALRHSSSTRTSDVAVGQTFRKAIHLRA